MGSIKAILKNPDDLFPLLKLKIAARNAEKQIPPEPHWGFCYSMLHKVSRSFGLVIQQLGPELRDAVSFSSQPFNSIFFMLFVSLILNLYFAFAGLHFLFGSSCS